MNLHATSTVQHPPRNNHPPPTTTQHSPSANRPPIHHRNLQPLRFLHGKVFDAGGMPLLAVHATKGRVRYRYYVSRSLQEAKGGDGWRVPARELESVVAERLALEARKSNSGGTRNVTL